MDGVVIDSEKLYFQSEEKLLARYGVKFEDSDWNYIKGCTESQFYDLIYDRFSIEVDRKTLILQGRNFLKDIFSKKLQYMSGFSNLYSFLRKKYKLALVTSTGPDIFNHVDALLSIREKFDLVFTSADTNAHKPMPDPYLNAMSALGFSSSECIVVEDSIQGIKSGRAAGCRVIALEGSIDRKFLGDADCIISHLSDMQNIL